MPCNATDAMSKSQIKQYFNNNYYYYHYPYTYHLFLNILIFYPLLWARIDQLFLDNAPYPL